ncbi:MAG TPA: hypothetical protein VGN26_24605 [Armatimonadota bacterium]
MDSHDQPRDHPSRRVSRPVERVPTQQLQQRKTLVLRVIFGSIFGVLLIGVVRDILRWRQRRMSRR